jgi:glycosyltransferase involved in cell wall biosynthesis
MRLSRVGLAPYPSKPNFSLNMPNKPVEYLSAGLPILSSLRGDLETLLASADCGMTYPNGNAAALADYLIRLYDAPGRLAIMSRNAQSLYLQRFTSDKVYGDLIHYLEELAEWRAGEPA